MTSVFRTRTMGWLAAVLVASAALAGCGDDKDEPAPAASAAVEQVNVQAGLNDPQDNNIAVLAFLPSSVTIAAGKSVEWRIPGPEPHSITFTADGKPPAPADEKLFPPTPPTGPYDGKSLVNSGLAPLGPAPAAPFKVTFPKAGTFTYYCVIHPNMTGTVTVVDANGKVDTQADVTGRANSEQARWLEEGRAAKKKLVDTPAVAEKAADGTTTYKLLMGATTPHTDVLAFTPPPAQLKAGDKVTFVNTSEAPHTASFAGKTILPADPTSAATENAAPGKSPQTLNATDFFNTGVLPPNAGPPGSIPPEAVRSFTFVMPFTAGNYTFVCILHAPSGMAASLKVA
ncbi:MAG TPA: plastocyanin/azurin family copper-binding protein [Acidimicrobiales bacterium]|nr:plastocyanin/azurin family copper-binding protein [Acidimicrobiales bacterium]